MLRTGQIHRPGMNGESSRRWTALQSATANNCQPTASQILSPCDAPYRDGQNPQTLTTKRLTTTVAKNAVGDRTQATTRFVPGKPPQV